MSLEEFLKQKRISTPITTGRSNLIQQFQEQKKKKINIPQSSSLIQQFQEQKKKKINIPQSSSTSTLRVTTPTPKKGIISKALELGQKVSEKIPKPVKTGWQWISKQLMKPTGYVAAETEALGTFIGTQKLFNPKTSQGYFPGKVGAEVLIGKKSASFTELWTKHGTQMGISPRVAGAIGFVSDIVIDPMNFFGAGLTTKGKLAQKVTSLKKAGKIIKPGSKLAKQIAKAGLNVDDLVLGATKAEQAALGQRSLLKFLGKPLVKGEKVYAIGEKATQTLGATKLGRMFKHTFITKTGNKAFDDLVDNFNNLSNYRKGQVIETATDIQKSIKKMQPVKVKMVAEVLERPEVRNNITDPNIIKTADKLEDLFRQMRIKEKATGVLKTELPNYFPHIKAKETLNTRIKAFFSPKVYNQKLGAAKGRKISGTIAEINQAFGKEFFQSNPAIAYAQRGLASAKAVTAKEFLDEVGKKFFVNTEDAPIRFMRSTNPLFNGLRAEPEIVRGVDKYIQGIQPDELRTIIRAFDSTQNWWKAQALISPSYHIRNMVGNFWNNWLAGVKNPISYAKAKLVQGGKKLDNVLLETDAGEILTRGQILDEAKRTNVIGKGFYGADIERILADEIGGKWTKANKLKALLPWHRENILFKTNRAIGEAIEDNARLAHFIDLRQKGFSMADAARSVKKFLFDYADLTTAEKTVMKRLMPFYTWTRKNIPLQIENLLVQPEKYAAIPKIIRQIERGTPEPKTEKYMSDYITSNIPVRIRTNPQGNTEYFLLGNWLPSAQAIDFLSRPIESIMAMVTPFVKTPYELWSNKSTFFKNTLGEPSEIEFYYRQPTEFLDIPMRRKTATLLRNVRVLNDINKLIKTPAKDEPENSWTVKLLNVLFGKAQTYDIKKSRYFYQRDTEQRIQELEAAIKKARKMGEKEHAQQLIQQLKKFQKERGY